MVSEIDESASEVTVDPDEIHPRGYDDSDKPVLGPIEESEVDLDAKEEKKEYRYGPTDNQKTVTIDDSLNKLFQCMSIAYEGQLTSPKWKSFKGLRLKVKDKIRLNNIIWREWHMQYVSGRRPPVCGFQTTIDVHNKPEAVLLEGKYWKRGTLTVTAEYKKWRMFSIKEKNANLSNCQSDYGSEKSFGFNDYRSNSLQDSLSLDDDFMNFNDNSLFSLLQPNSNIAFPSVRELARSGVMVDCIQPSLSQLQPPIVDFMDFEDLFPSVNQSRVNVLPTLPEENQSEVDASASTLSSNLVKSNCSAVSIRPTTVDCQATPTQVMTTLTDLTSQTSGIQAMSSYEVSSFVDPSTQQVSNVGLQMDYQPLDTSKKDNSVMSFVTSSSYVQSMPVQYMKSTSSYPHTSMEVEPSMPAKYSQLPSGSFSPPLQSCVPLRANQSSSLNRVNSAGLPLASPPSNMFLPPMTNMVPRKVSPRGPLERSSSLPVYGRGSSSCAFDTSGNRPRGDSPASTSLIAQLLNSNNNIRPPNIQPYQMAQQQQPQPQQSHSFTQLNHTSRQSSFASATSSPQSSFGNYVPISPPSSSSTSPLAETSGFVMGIPVTEPSSSGRPMSARFTDDLAYGFKKETPVRKISSPARICSNHPAAVNPFKEPGSPSSIHLHHSMGGRSSSSTITRKLSPSHSLSPSGSLSSPPLSSPLPSASAPSQYHQEHDKMQYKEHRRVCHINAEQKRRCNIKNGFDTLRQILPSVSQNTNTKISKAAMLQKAAEHIRQLKHDQQQKREECEQLKQEIEKYNQAISLFQNQLPATGAPVACQRSGHVKEIFKEYVKQRTMENWKFFIFSTTIMESLLESFDASTSTSNMNELCKTTMHWLDTNCSLVSIRKDVLNSLRHLSTTTSILTNPAVLPEESLRAVSSPKLGEE